MQLAEPRFGATAKIHVPRTERPVLLPGLVQAAQLGENCGKLGIAEFGQGQERRPSGQVVMSHDSRQLSSDAHTPRMPESRRCGRPATAELSRYRPRETFRSCRGSSVKRILLPVVATVLLGLGGAWSGRIYGWPAMLCGGR